MIDMELEKDKRGLARRLDKLEHEIALLKRALVRPVAPHICLTFEQRDQSKALLNDIKQLNQRISKLHQLQAKASNIHDWDAVNKYKAEKLDFEDQRYRKVSEWHDLIRRCKKENRERFEKELFDGGTSEHVDAKKQESDETEPTGPVKWT